MTEDITIDREDAPRYRQLANAYAAAIRAGELSAGDALPPERRIAEQHGVSRVTVRKALARLAEDGLIESRHGSGHYVARRLQAPLTGVRGFSEEARSRGMTPTVEWLECAMGGPDPEEALALGLAPGARIARLIRLRRADGVPIAIESAAVPDWALPDAGLVELSLYDALEARGMRPVRALQRIAATALDARRAGLLTVREGDPALFTVRVGYLADGRAVEHSRTWSRADRWDFVTELA